MYNIIIFIYIIICNNPSAKTEIYCICNIHKCCNCPRSPLYLFNPYVLALELKWILINKIGCSFTMCCAVLFQHLMDEFPIYVGIVSMKLHLQQWENVS